MFWFHIYTKNNNQRQVDIKLFTLWLILIFNNSSSLIQYSIAGEKSKKQTEFVDIAQSSYCNLVPDRVVSTLNFNWKRDNNMGLRGEVFSTRANSDKRTYFFNVKENRNGDLFLNIVESKKHGEEGFERHSVMVFEEDIEEFVDSFQKAADFIVRKKKK